MVMFGLIGGRSIEELEHPILEKRMFQFLSKDKPNVLFFPFASENIEASCLKFKSLMASCSCFLDFVTNLQEEHEIRNKMEWADVFYFGGGHIDLLMERMSSSKLPILLKANLNSNKLFCGVSAGAILWCQYGMGDKYAYTNAYQTYHYKMVRGLGFLPITLCPHYDHNGLWCYNDEVKEYPFSGYALEDDTAIILINGKVFPLKSVNSKSIYLFDIQKSYEMNSLYEETKE